MRARTLSPKLGEVLGHPVVVVNKPDASGQLDSEAKFRDSQTLTKLIQDLYPRIGEMIKQAGLMEIAK